MTEPTNVDPSDLLSTWVGLLSGPDDQLPGPMTGQLLRDLVAGARPWLVAMAQVIALMPPSDAKGLATAGVERAAMAARAHLLNDIKGLLQRNAGGEFEDALAKVEAIEGVMTDAVHAFASGLEQCSTSLRRAADAADVANRPQ